MNRTGHAAYGRIRISIFPLLHVRCITTIQLLATALGLASPTTHAEDPWADEVIEYTADNPASGFTDPLVALGEPEGVNASVPLNTDNVVSLGDPSGTPRGRLVLKFDTPVTDDPANPFGLDCIVYSNAFWVGGNPQKKFQEPAIIEISDDGINWFLIPGSRNFTYPAGALPLIAEPSGADNLTPGQEFSLAGTITNPNTLAVAVDAPTVEFNWGYAEMTPTLAPYLDNYVRPDDPFTVDITPRSGGGDAFDIAWAIAPGGAAAGLTQFKFIRLSPFVQRSLAVGAASPEILAVADVAPDLDTDGDGILDDYETRVIETDPARPENTLLPLEIPVIEGGSPQGAVLGTASDIFENTLTLISDGSRADSVIDVIVDILRPTAPVGALPIPSLIMSDVTIEIVSSEPNFLAAEIQTAEITIPYTPLRIEGLHEPGLSAYRFNGVAYDQVGLSNIVVDTAMNEVRLRSQFSGVFVLAAPAGSGDPGGPEVYVDFDYVGRQLGTLEKPYSTLAEGVAGVSPGGIVHVLSGDTSETMLMSKPMRLEASGGVVRVGPAVSRRALRNRESYTTTNALPYGDAQ